MQSYPHGVGLHKGKHPSAKHTKKEQSIMNIQLSISLLASDRPAALERCLDSLTPLLIRVPSELIIVHTGTDSKVSELAHCYTDLVLPFAWCNDFSAARNTGIKATKGEWFFRIKETQRLSAGRSDTV